MSTVANILTRVGYRVHQDGEAISTTTYPLSTECIEWINEWTRTLSKFCARYESDIGRTVGSITTVDGTAAYSTLTDILTPGVIWDEDGKSYNGWIEKTSSRVPIYLTTLGDKVNFAPGTSNEGEPEKYYLSGASEVTFLPTPDDAYTVYIPYYQVQTAASATTDTMPFNEFFDDLYVEFVSWRHLNRGEYDTSVEQKWMTGLQQQAIQLIQMRKNPMVEVIY